MGFVNEFQVMTSHLENHKDVSEKTNESGIFKKLCSNRLILLYIKKWTDYVRFIKIAL